MVTHRRVGGNEKTDSNLKVEQVHYRKIGMSRENEETSVREVKESSG